MNNKMTLANRIWNILKLEDRPMTIKEINEIISDKPESTIRGRLRDKVNALFKRVDRGVYIAIDEDADTCIAVLEKDGRDLSFLEDESIDAIITDHPYEDKKSHIGGDRKLVDYECFKYTIEDFKEKSRVLKEGAFLVEFMPEENANNYEYIYEIKKMAEKCGLFYYACVPWKKGKFVSNMGRKAKNKEYIMFFTKGKARTLRIDKQRAGMMSGTTYMLPTEFDFQPQNIRKKKHKAEKPVLLFKSIIEAVTLPGEIILDQFAGSGNLGIAAIISNRIAILIEKNKETFEKIINNIKENGIKVSCQPHELLL